VPDKLAELHYELALANRILANENVFDAFGHVSLRHPEDPNRYLLSRSRAPQLVEPADILEFTLDNPEVDTIARDRRADAHKELKRWLSGDHTSNNTYR